MRGKEGEETTDLSIRTSFEGSIEALLLGESGGYPASRADDLRLREEAMANLYTITRNEGLMGDTSMMGRCGRVGNDGEKNRPDDLARIRDEWSRE